MRSGTWLFWRLAGISGKSRKLGSTGTPLFFYNEEGEVFYKTEEQDYIQLEYRGYDKSRKSQRFGFPKNRKDRRIFRIACSENPRIFPRISRQSKKFKREYRRRTAVERMNGRLDRDFRFEDRSIRGLAKTDLFVSMAFLIQLAFACANVREQGDKHLAAWVV